MYNHLLSAMKFAPELFDSEYWFQNAERLKISANVLREKLLEQKERKEISVPSHIHNNQKLAFMQSHMMLVGFAIENQLKGYSVFQYKRRNPDITISDFNFLRNEVWKVKSGHELIKIAENSGLELRKADRELLERYEKFLRWAGRYHIPPNPSEYEDSFGQSKLKYSSSDDNSLKEFFYWLSYQMKETSSKI